MLAALRRQALPLPGWHAFDPRNNAPRIGRTLIACSRDAADVPLTHIFGPGVLSGFKVWTDEAVE